MRRACRNPFSADPASTTNRLVVEQSLAATDRGRLCSSNRRPSRARDGNGTDSRLRPEDGRAIELARSKPGGQHWLCARAQCGHPRWAIGSEKPGRVSVWGRAVCARCVHVAGDLEGHAPSWPHFALLNWAASKKTQRTRRSASLQHRRLVAAAGCVETCHAWHNKGHAIGCRWESRRLA